LNKRNIEMDSPMLYRWNVSDLSIEAEDPYAQSKRNTFTLNGTDIKVWLSLEPPDEDNGEMHREFNLMLFDFGEEESVTVKFRLWAESCSGKKLIEKPFELTHTFTSSDNTFGVKEFMLDNHFDSFEFNHETHNSVNFCCEIMRIKPDSGFLVGFKLHEESHSLYKSGFIGDCILKANGQDFNVPKSLLMASSQVFKNIFTSHTKEARTNTLKIEDVSSEVLEKFTKYLHVGKLEEKDQSIEELFIFADRYIVENLTDLCTKHLASTFGKENIARRLKLALTYKNAELKNHALFYLTNYGAEGNFKEMLKSDGWKKLMIEDKMAHQIMDVYFEGTKRL